MLIGTPIFGTNGEQLGTIQDFVVSSRGGSTNLYLAMTPSIANWNQGYVVVPYSALQSSFNSQQGTNQFTLNLSADALRRAPTLTIDQWNTTRDPGFFSFANQFYQPTQRIAGRPDLDDQLGNPFGPGAQVRLFNGTHTGTTGSVSGGTGVSGAAISGGGPSGGSMSGSSSGSISGGGPSGGVSADTSTSSGANTGGSTAGTTTGTSSGTGTDLESPARAAGLSTPMNTSPSGVGPLGNQPYLGVGAAPSPMTPASGTGSALSGFVPGNTQPGIGMPGSQSAGSLRSPAVEAAVGTGSAGSGGIGTTNSGTPGLNSSSVGMPSNGNTSVGVPGTAAGVNARMSAPAIPSGVGRTVPSGGVGIGAVQGVGGVGIGGIGGAAGTGAGAAGAARGGSR